MTSWKLFLPLFLVAACDPDAAVESPSPRGDTLESLAAGGGGGASGSSCCPASTTPGCAANAAVQTCVCARDAYCCSTRWDAACAIEVTSYGCANLCGAGGASGAGGGPACCPQKGTQGCTDPVVEQCVCGTLGDRFCCDTRWDEECAAEALNPCACSSGPQPVQGNCCTATEGVPGCTDAVVEACVCALDGGCCTNEWDEACVEEVGEFACGTACPTP